MPISSTDTASRWLFLMPSTYMPKALAITATLPPTTPIPIIRKSYHRGFPVQAVASNGSAAIGEARPAFLPPEEFPRRQTRRLPGRLPPGILSTAHSWQEFFRRTSHQPFSIRTKERPADSRPEILGRPPEMLVRMKPGGDSHFMVSLAFF